MSSTILDLKNPALELSLLPTPLSIIQLTPTSLIPPALLTILAGGAPSPSPPPFISFTRTPTETSIILPTTLYSSLYPPTATEQPLETSGPWSALVVKGPMDLSLTGIMHALTGPLGEAKVPVFTSSTWDTDYVLINSEKEGKAKEALQKAGWQFSQ
jgi:uncharacterized protein